ncbi:serine/threonine-protein kinase [Actinomadura oligospora]|uniref:serine/threonine-protein kinase n=1 Tax=Actinomadura oligospora TaxID=111804 RepID=UPI0004B343D2|nr:serine/threonine-protein kinase [Actinomadura oligospora]
MLPLDPADPAVMGPYTLVARIGAGGMGRVYLGRSPGGRPVAVKVIRPDLADEPGFRARFQREVTAARQVSGAYTAPVLDADPEAATPWMATAYIAGPSLQQAIDTHGPLSPTQARTLGAALAEAMAAIHDLGQIHRDLKPANILLAADGPRVIDFGIARALEDTTLTATGLAVGSAGYQAPEQAEGRQVDPAADVFALGAVLAFACTGSPPFGAGPPHVLMYRAAHEPADLAGIPDDLAETIAACLSKLAADRPTARDLIGMLRPTVVAGGRAWPPEPVVRDIADREAALVHTFVVTRVLPKRRALPSRRRLLIGGLTTAGLAAAASGGAALLRAGKGHASTPNGRPIRGNVQTPRTFNKPRFVWRAGGSGALRTPVVAGTTLLCANQTIDASMWATDIRTGEHLWNSPFTTRLPLWGKVAAVADGSRVYGIGNGLRYTANAATGKRLWSAPSDGLIPQFVIGRTLICVDASGHAIALDTISHRMRWRRKLYAAPSGAPPVTAVASAEANLLLLGEPTGVVRAFDATSGTKRWERAGVAGPTTLLAGGVLYIGGPNHPLTALDVRTGVVRWTVARRAYSLALSGGRLFVGGDGIAALNPATGAPQWTRNGQQDQVGLDNGIAGFAGGVVVYVRSQLLKGVDPAAGTIVWSLPLPGFIGLNNFTVTSGNHLFVGNENAVLALAF